MKKIIVGLLLFTSVFISCSKEDSKCAICTTVTTLNGAEQPSLLVIQELCDTELEFNDGLVDVDSLGLITRITTTTCD